MTKQQFLESPLSFPKVTTLLIEKGRRLLCAPCHHLIGIFFPAKRTPEIYLLQLEVTIGTMDRCTFFQTAIPITTTICQYILPFSHRSVEMNGKLLLVIAKYVVARKYVFIHIF